MISKYLNSLKILTFPHPNILLQGKIIIVKKIKKIKEIQRRFVEREKKCKGIGTKKRVLRHITPSKTGYITIKNKIKNKQTNPSSIHTHHTTTPFLTLHPPPPLEPFHLPQPLFLLSHSQPLDLSFLHSSLLYHTMVMNERPTKRVKRRVTADLYDFLSFPTAGDDSAAAVPFRNGVYRFLSDHARSAFPPELFPSLMTWQILFRVGEVGDGGDVSSGLVTLDIVEEDVTRSRTIYCDQCRVVGELNR